MIATKEMRRIALIIRREGAIVTIKMPTSVVVAVVINAR